jgi:hypothetical protein
MGMSRPVVLAVAAIVLLVGWATHGPVGLVLAILLEATVYFISLRLHPRIRHTGILGLGWFTCRGTGEKHSHLFRWIWHRDARCGGSGRIIRWGARRWGTDNIRRAEVLAATQRSNAKRLRTWR